jgi:dimeric dUTPase (all-alpha-NTP-PPase superfamily)
MSSNLLYFVTHEFLVYFTVTSADCGIDFSIHFSHTAVFNDHRSKRSFSHNAHVLDLYLAENMFSSNSSVYNNYFQKSFLFSEI